MKKLWITLGCIIGALGALATIAFFLLPDRPLMDCEHVSKLVDAGAKRKAEQEARDSEDEKLCEELCAKCGQLPHV